ncbi:hypothetical protein C2S53_019988 [Perilla frutescens var. hirtella]|uniref:DUF4378 domain-containing protein n=1 Tax=Perilla frutescens var. hirtella TaxID=608512 RepID=A0AAD4J6Z7_PERFH|nr:hypothetical protein C2S53_019988 [Perilla frutescens var. hirtella]
MGKHLWVKNLDDESQVKQPGCMWGDIYTRASLLIGNRSLHGGRGCGYEKLLDDEQESESPLHLHGATKKKQSLRARIKAIYTEETSEEGKDARRKKKGGGGHGFSSTKSSSSLHRTYSIHHLQSVDDFFGKIRTDWNNSPIIFLPTNSASHDNLNADRGESHLHTPKEKPDVFEIFKVDKELLLKHLQDSDESIANFSRTAFGFTTKGKFSKSRSFPVPALPQRRNHLKPLKLESKHKEVWSFPKDDKVHQSPSESLDNYREAKVDRINGEKRDDDGIRKHTHQRSSSLNESLDKYARLFENSFGKDVKLSSSQSLRLTTEYGYAPLSFKRKRSLSNADSYYSEVFGKEHESRIDMLDSSIDTDDPQSIRGKPLSTRYPHKKNSDLDYVRHLLHKSGIAIDASEMPWHASDQLFGPQLFEEVEAGWPHDEDQLDGLPDFQGCWHHQMLFDLVNEVLLDVYDISLPYYPKALSSSCQVRSFPMGDRVIEEVCTSIGTLMNIKPEEKESLDCVVGRDLVHDRRWMNLQLESESVAIYLEDMIFDELLQEVIFS